MIKGQRGYKIQTRENDQQNWKEIPGYSDLGVCLDLVLQYGSPLTGRWPVDKLHFQEFKWSGSSWEPTGGEFPKPGVTY